TSSVDIAAPGVDVASTYPNNGYVYLSGTSMATPHVTGVVALVLSQSPALGYSDVIGRVLNGADALPGLSSKVAGGRRLNAFGAVNAAAPDTSGPRILSAVANGTASASSVRLTFGEAIDAISFDASDISHAPALTGVGVSAVAGSNNTQFDVTFNPVTAPGTYGFTVGPHITDLALNEMDQNND